MKKLSGRKTALLLTTAVLISGALVFVSINPAETSPKCMPGYMKQNGSDECVTTATSSDASIQVLGPDE